MMYLAVVTNDIYDEDFCEEYRWFKSLEEAQSFKKSMETDDFTCVDIYKTERI